VCAAPLHLSRTVGPLCVSTSTAGPPKGLDWHLQPRRSTFSPESDAMTSTQAAEAQLSGSDFVVSVHEKERLAEGVVGLAFKGLDEEMFPLWTPGAHVDLVLPDGVVRQYSLCGDPRDRSVLEVAVLREPASRGGSVYIHDTMQQGDQIRLRGPRNNFKLAPASEYLFIAGGIGITPLIPMLAEVEARGSDWRLLYGGRARASMAFRDELVAQYGARVELCPQDELGLLDLETAIKPCGSDALIYCCGPEPLINAVQRACKALPPESLRIERFAPRSGGSVDKTGQFEIELASSGEVLTVPSGKTILEVLNGAGVPTYASCQEGTCGSCETPVLSGAIDHRDEVLSDEERQAGDVMMICVSRAACARLRLDL
jgi:ferredoxin-NADP reductase